MHRTRSNSYMSAHNSHHVLLHGPARSGKTSRLVDELVEQWRHDPLSWNRVQVWCRSTGAVHDFRARLDKAMRSTTGYPTLRVQTPQRWASDVLSKGRFGVPHLTVWPRWFEQDQIHRACRALHESWPPGPERESLDDPSLHRAIHQWFETLALNKLHAAHPPESVRALRNGARALRLASVAEYLAERKDGANAIGEQEVYSALHQAFTDSPQALAGWRAETKMLVIDDAQDLHTDAADLAALWCNEDNQLFAAIDPLACSASFRGADVEKAQRLFGSLCETHELPLSKESSPGVQAAQALQTSTPLADLHEATLLRLNTRNEIEEAYELARRVRRAVFRSRSDHTPLRWKDCAVVAQSLRTTGTFLSDAFRFYNIPFAQSSGERLTSVPLIRYALDYLRSFIHAADPTAEPPDALLLHGLSGLPVPQTAIALRTGELADSGIPEWKTRWAEQRDTWHASGATLLTALETLATKQVFPAVEAARADGAARSLDDAELTQLFDLADYLDHALHSDSLGERLATLERIAGHERESRAIPSQDRDCVHILTPYAALDRRYKWLAIAGFVEGSWPPVFHSHALRLDHVLEDWNANTPATTSWAISPPAHEEQWRRLAAATLQQADGEVVLSVPAHSPDGRALEASPWMALLEAGIKVAEPLHDRAAGLKLEAALTLSEAAAAVRHGPADAKSAVYETLNPNHPTEKHGVQPPVHLGTRKLSASLLNAYIQCPRMCFYTRLLRIEDREQELSTAGAFGDVIHNVLEELHSESFWPQWTGADLAKMQSDARELLDRHWQASNIHALHENPISAQRAQERASALLDGYTRWLAEEHTGVSVVAREESFEFEHCGATLAGRIDRIDRFEDGRLRIIDYKTGSHSYATGEAAVRRFVATEKKARLQDADVQLATYFFGSTQLQDVHGPVAETALWFLKVDETESPKAPTIVWDGGDATDKRTYALTEQQVEEARAFLGEQIERVRSGLFPAEPLKSNLCQRCVVRQVCDRAQNTDEEASP